MVGLRCVALTESDCFGEAISVCASALCYGFTLPPSSDCLDVQKDQDDDNHAARQNNFDDANDGGDDDDDDDDDH